MCVEQFARPLIFCRCFVRETSTNRRDVQQLDMKLYGNVSLDNDLRYEEEISVSLLRECNPKTIDKREFYSDEKFH